MRNASRPRPAAIPVRRNNAPDLSVFRENCLFCYEFIGIIPIIFYLWKYKNFKEPAAVEHIRAQAGLDIGGTLIGMHLAEVAVPVRLSVKKIGEANLLCARVRPKFIGGERAHYNPDLK